LKTSVSGFTHAKCSKTKKPFIIRFDKGADGKWCMTYGLVPVQPTQNSGSTETMDFSRFRIGPQYKCPYCGNKTIVECGCGSIGCYDGKSETYYCHECNTSGKVSGSIVSLKGKGGNAQ
jgi:hypothetical protein